MSESAHHVSHLRIADPDGLVGAIRGGHLEPWLLDGKHRGQSELSRIVLPGSCLDHAELGAAMWFRGALPKSCYTMVYVTKCPQEGHSLNFNSRHRDQCLGFFAPGEVLDATTPAGYSHGTLTIPETVFLKAVESRYPEIPPRLLKRGCSVFPREDACRRLTALLSLTAEVIRLAPDVLASEPARCSLESELHDHFLDLLQADRRIALAVALPGMTRRYHRMSLVRDYIRDHSQRRILLPELCAVSGLSRRGLEYLFVDLLGVRAQAFLLQLRLRGVRRELLAAGPQPRLVKECAMNWGFWHLGRFAMDYQALFGEKPSTTLARYERVL